MIGVEAPDASSKKFTPPLYIRATYSGFSDHRDLGVFYVWRCLRCWGVEMRARVGVGDFGLCGRTDGPATTVTETSHRSLS